MYNLQFTSDNAEPRLIGTWIIGFVLYFNSRVLQLTSNPKSVFVRGEGQILKILNEEFGVALAAMKPNSWESILFHRSACFLFRLNLGSHDLTSIFEEGEYQLENNITCIVELLQPYNTYQKSSEKVTLWRQNVKVHHHIHNSSPLAPILS
jgi:hypothetical protein